MEIIIMVLMAAAAFMIGYFVIDLFSRSLDEMLSVGCYKYRSAFRNRYYFFTSLKKISDIAAEVGRFWESGGSDEVQVYLVDDKEHAWLTARK